MGAGWGQADLAGSVNEWNLDFAGTPPALCRDCAITSNAGPNRVIRSGSYIQGADRLVTTHYGGGDVPTGNYGEYGVRCAR